MSRDPWRSPLAWTSQHGRHAWRTLLWLLNICKCVSFPFVVGVIAGHHRQGRVRKTLHPFVWWNNTGNSAKSDSWWPVLPVMRPLVVLEQILMRQSLRGMEMFLIQLSFSAKVLMPLWPMDSDKVPAYCMCVPAWGPPSSPHPCRV